MIEFIAKYWLEFAFGCMIAVGGGAYKRIKKHLKKEDLVKIAIVALLHDRIYSLCTEYITREYVTVAELRNLGYLYNSYHSLGGNGTGTALYEKVKDLDVKEE